MHFSTSLNSLFSIPLQINLVSSSCKELSLQMHSLLSSFNSVPRGHLSKHKFQNMYLGGFSSSNIYYGIE